VGVTVIAPGVILTGDSLPLHPNKTAAQQAATNTRRIPINNFIALWASLKTRF
jgi:hypothetical protein